MADLKPGDYLNYGQCFEVTEIRKDTGTGVSTLTVFAREVGVIPSPSLDMSPSILTGHVTISPVQVGPALLELARAYDRRSRAQLLEVSLKENWSEQRLDEVLRGLFPDSYFP